MRGIAKKTTGQVTKPADEAVTLLAHVRELQFRLLVTAGVLVAAGVVAYLYYPQIIDILRKPLNAPLIISSVSGSFSFVMKICLIAGIAVSVPLIVYNFIMFVRPAFIEVFTRKRVVMMTAGSVAAAFGGMLFGYFFIIPGAIHFFNGFHVSGVTSMIQADGYLNFVTNVLVTFVLMFQLPIVVSLIDRITPISPRAMLKGEKWALVGSILISLVVPFAMDLMTQLLIAAPIFLLYNISFVVVVFQHKYAASVNTKAVRAEKRREAASRRATKRIPAVAPARHAAAIQPAFKAPQPHPQLAEVMALQAGTKPPVAIKAPAPAVSAPTQPAVRPTMNRRVMTDMRASAPKIATHRIAPAPAKPTPVTIPTSAAQVPAPSFKSMDSVSPVAGRALPTQVIRRAAVIKAPERGLGVPGRLAPPVPAR